MGTWAQGSGRAGRAGRGHRGEGMSAPPQDPPRELRPPGSGGQGGPARGSWRRSGPAIRGQGAGRPVPGLELFVIDGPQALATCLLVQPLREQEILEGLAGFPELPAAELGHLGGGGGSDGGTGRGSGEMKLKVAGAAAGSWLPEKRVQRGEAP